MPSPHPRNRLRAPLVAAWVLLAPTLAFAAEGVIEISQDAIHAGSGFPFVISLPGSYVLTSDLDVTGTAQPYDTDAIQVTASDVTLDLNGFSIRGPVTCSGSLGSIGCTGAGTGIGIYQTDGDATGLVVRNGFLRGFASAAVHCYGCTLEDLLLEQNLQWGAFLANPSSDGHGGRVSRCMAYYNNGPGFELGSEAFVEDSVAYRNVGFGFLVGSYSVVTRSMAIENLGDGISSGGTLVESCTAVRNSGKGIELAFGGQAIGNTAQGNGGVGFSCFAGPCGFGQNVFEGNNGGSGQPQSSGGVEMGLNLCDTDTTCP